MKKRFARSSNILGWILLVLTVAVYLFSPGHETYGQDFFYYQSLAKLSREVPVERMYHAREELLNIQAGAAAWRLNELTGREIDTTQARSFPTTTDPRYSGSPLPRAIYPQWAALREFTYHDYSKVSPATYGIFRLLNFDRLSFSAGYRFWNIASLVMLFCGLVLVKSWAGLPCSWSWCAVAALWFDPVLSSFIYGQFMELLFLLLAFFLWLRRPVCARYLAAGVCLGVATVIKPLGFGLVVLIFWELIFGADRRSAGRQIAGCVAGAAVTVLFFEIQIGFGIFGEWLSTFGDWYSTYHYTMTSLANRSAPAALIAWFNLAPTGETVRLASGIYLAAILAIYGWFFLLPRNRARLREAPAVAAAMALLGPLVTSRFLLNQYEVLLIIPLAALASQALHSRARSLGALVCIFYIGFGFYEKSEILLHARPEIFLYPVMLFALGKSAER